ncbi:hypothetical protein [Rhizobium sp. BK176]|uniref:hypothetical protein n=1 Tax=Rhizobium sp. BK176 TaxID=2587071 RepID=UPI002166C6E4|nr:hypothetical protein [Rhizobium sp. BK176]MCS4089508.1 hypothetical protein [Rhizobium sp. BK176]
MTPTREQLVEAFTFGKCYAMAVALHEETGWPIGVLLADYRDTGRSTDVRRRAVHAFVLTPNDDVFDARGVSGLDELRNAFFLPNNGRIIESSWVEECDAVEDFKTCLVNTEKHLHSKARLRSEIDYFLETTVPAARAASLELGLVAQFQRECDATRRLITASLAA